MSENKQTWGKPNNPQIHYTRVIFVMVGIVSVFLSGLYFNEYKALINKTFGKRDATLPIATPTPVPKKDDVILFSPSTTAEFVYQRESELFTSFPGTTWRFKIHSMIVSESGEVKLNLSVCNTGNSTATLDKLHLWHTSREQTETINWELKHSLTYKPGECDCLNNWPSLSPSEIFPLARPLGTLFISPDGISRSAQIDLATAELKNEKPNR